MNRLDKTLLITVLLLGGILWLQHRWTIRLTEERDRFRMNSTALLSDVKRMRTDSATMALDAKALRLTIDEYEEFRAEDAETIRRLGVKIRNLEAAAATRSLSVIPSRYCGRKWRWSRRIYILAD